MKKALLFLFLFPLMALAQRAEEIHIIPQPASLQVGAGYFSLSPSTPLVATQKQARTVAQLFAEKVNCSTGWGLAPVKKAKTPAIQFVLTPRIAGEEAYELHANAQGITLEASTEAGLFYAMQTLLQLLPAEVEQPQAHHVEAWQVPAVEIKDAPRFPHRGIMLDPCRHFLPLPAVKRHIDLIASYKLNRLHWHLTDDQGWRVESKRYPELNRIASYRTEGNGEVTGGFYTWDEIREVVAYAKARHIEVIPELEMPGHELAAIATFPELSCRGEAITPRIVGGVEDVVMCPGKENMFEFLQNVIDEWVPLFPYQYFHIGGDESPRGEWAKCPNCQARMKAEGLTKEAQLQTYIIHRMEKYLAKKGKRIIGWDEILEGEGLATTAIVMSWRGEKGGIEAAKMGHQVLMAPADNGLYFDHYQSDPIVAPMNYICGYSPITKVYGYDPVPAVLAGTPAEKYVLGVQANNWSEYTYTPAQLEHKLYPRALALAEVAWTPTAQKDFADFQRRLDGDAALRLAARGVNFHIPVPEQPEGSCNHLAFTHEALLTLSTPRPATIVFTTDGTNPTAQSPRYVAPLHLTRTTTVRCAVLLPCGLLSPVRTIEATKMNPLKAKSVESTQAGLNVRKWEGRYERPTQLQPEAAKEVAGGIQKPEQLRALTQVPGNVRGVKDYAAEAYGYVRIEKEGVYEFATNHCQLYIDGRLLVDNSTQPNHRHSLDNAQIALEAGLHEVRILFLGGIYDFWPTWWDDADVRIRPVTPTASPQSYTNEWRKLTEQDFCK